MGSSSWYRHIHAIALLALCAVFFGSTLVHADEPPLSAPSAQADVFGGFASTHIIVQYAQEVSDPALTRSRAVDDLHLRWRVTDLRPAYPFEFAHPDLAAKYGLDRTFIVEVPQGTDTPALAAEYTKLEGVEAATVDGIGGIASGLYPNDTRFDWLYGLHNVGQTGGVVDADIDAPEAWELHTGDYGTVTVAVIDSGVDPHVEYANRLIPGMNTDERGPPELTTDGCPHGTHVAGTIAAEGNNDLGVAGVTWGALIMPVRVLGTPDGCHGTEHACANGIIWATDNGADICNLSLQYPSGSSYFPGAVNYAHDAGVLLVAAAGNAASTPLAYPAQLEKCMGVAATNSSDEHASFSNYGNQIDIAAPGVAIWSTWPGNGYYDEDGTSMATPHVTGVAALAKSYAPDLTGAELRSLLTSTADDLGDAGWDQYFGFGRVNAHHALLSVDTPLELLESNPPDGAIDARQPSNPDGTDSRRGWSSIVLTFSGYALDIQRDDFSVTQDGGEGDPPTVMIVSAASRSSVVVGLSKPITPAAWTTITYLPTGASVRLGYLPADVNTDGTSSALDILAIVNAYNGVLGTLPIWQTDINQSGQLDAGDILRVVDLLNGAEQYDAYNGVSLP